MSSTAAFLASFASILIGAAIGMVLKRTLPADLLEGGSKEAIRLGRTRLLAFIQGDDAIPHPHGAVCVAGTLISCGRMSAATITSRQSAPNVCSMVTKPPCS